MWLVGISGEDKCYDERKEEYRKSERMWKSVCSLVGRAEDCSCSQQMIFRSLVCKAFVLSFNRLHLYILLNL